MSTISIWLKESPDHEQLKKRPILNQNEGIWQLVVKTIVVRKSLGQKCPCEFESHLEYYLFFDTSSVNCWLVKK